MTDGQRQIQGPSIDHGFDQCLKEDKNYTVFQNIYSCSDPLKKGKNKENINFRKKLNSSFRLRLS